MATLEPDVLRLIDGVNYAHVATLLPDGAPHTVPVWVGREGDRIAILTAPSARKARNVSRDPRVAISVVDHEKPYIMAQIRGRVTELLDGDEAWAVIDRIAVKYTGSAYPLRTDRVVLLIEPEHAQAISYG